MSTDVWCLSFLSSLTVWRWVLSLPQFTSHRSVLTFILIVKKNLNLNSVSSTFSAYVWLSMSPYQAFFKTGPSSFHCPACLLPSFHELKLESSWSICCSHTERDTALLFTLNYLYSLFKIFTLLFAPLTRSSHATRNSTTPLSFQATEPLKVTLNWGFKASFSSSFSSSDLHRSLNTSRSIIPQ